jgi:tripartite-type tricarboxylate transporter receptor subunit TctC
LAALAVFCTAQGFAQEPTRILVGFPPGGSADVLARLVAEGARAATGQAFVVDNKPGAAGQIAAELLKQAAPDGRTVMAAPMAVTVMAPLTHAKLRYDPNVDFSPIGLIASFQLAFSVGPAAPARTFAEYLAWIKAHPRQAIFGSPGAGSLPHFFGLMVGRAAGVDMLHVSYKGGAPLLNDLMGGQVAAGVDVLAEAVRHHEAGKLRILATSGSRRSTAAPTVPTFAELGHPAIQGEGWFAMYAPAGTPRAVIDRLSLAVDGAIRSGEVTERFRKLGIEPMGGGPEQLARRSRADSERWSSIVEASGFTADK